MSILQALVNQLQTATKPHQPEKRNRRTKALVWARVSTEKQEERGLSIPEQLREIRESALRRGIPILEEFSEAASAYRYQHRRIEFQRMLTRARLDPEVGMILVHDLSRFGRDSGVTKSQIDELRRIGVRVVSLNDPELGTETASDVYISAMTLAKNEAYSRDVAFHTRKGCRANIQARDLVTGWCYKNGGQPLFGYRSERLTRGEVKRGIPLIKSIWVLDETVVAGRTIHEWARYCLVEMAAKGASLNELRDFCNKTGIPGRRKEYWGTSTWNALLQPSVLLQFCGYGVWNVRDKRGRERPMAEWVIVENAHPALLSEAEAKQVAEMRRSQAQTKGFDAGPARSRSSGYLLSGGLFICGRCGANMTGFRTSSGRYYVCGSQPYRSGMGCGPGIYVPQQQVESEVVRGLEAINGACADPKGFTCQVNEELRRIWAERIGFDPRLTDRLRSVETKIAHVRKAIEDGLTDAGWANSRLQELFVEKEDLQARSTAGKPPKIDTAVALAYRRNVSGLLEQGDRGERKRLVRRLVERVELLPESLEVQIAYRVPEFIMNGLVAGVGFEPTTFGL